MNQRIWESIYNPLFNYGEFAIIKSQARLNSYKICVKDWIEKTNAIGLKVTAGKYGGTYAHPDIAFEFGNRAVAAALPYRHLSRQNIGH
nr:KilA-N domain-containing protein [uncultured Sphingobacterium sp.]